MGKQAKRAYLEAIMGRYRKADRAGKAKILDEFCAVCGYHRKYAIRLLNGQSRQIKLRGELWRAVLSATGQPEQFD